MGLIIIFLVIMFGVGGLTHVPVLGIVLGVVVTAVLYRHDVRRHPRVPCPVCKGSGDKRSWLTGGGPFRQPRGACGHCGGKKGVPRPALRLIDGEEREKIRAAIEKAKGEIRR